MNRRKIITAVAALPLLGAMPADARTESASDRCVEPSRIDYDAARKRLLAISTDPAVLEGFERSARTGEVDDAFLKAVYGTRISLDHLFLGRREPLIAA